MNKAGQVGEVLRALIQIVRRLLPERASEVLDFAQFLLVQEAKAGEGDQEYTEDDARWDALLAAVYDNLEEGHLAEN
jgi:hypothetical protein